MATSNLTVNPVPALALPEVIEAFRNVVTPHISDNLLRLSGVTGLKRFNRSRKLVGTAITVKARPGENLLIYKALMELQPGHVLVVDGGGDCTNALVGELIMQYAAARGCAGLFWMEQFATRRRSMSQIFLATQETSPIEAPTRWGPVQ